MKKFLGRNDMEDGLRRLDTLTQEEARMASAQRLQGVMLDLNDNVVSVISGEIRVRSRQTTIDDKLARSTIGMQPSPICYKACFDHDTPRWKRSKASRAADSQR
jgi:hypothetical protein